MKKTIFTCLFASLMLIQLNAQQNLNSTSNATFVQQDQVLFDGQHEFPQSEGWVTDVESVFTSEQEAELENMITDFEISSTHEIALVTKDDFGPYKDITEYASSLGNFWEVGKASSQNGVVFLVSIDKNLVHISAGQGMKEVLTEKVCQEIISYTIVPEFKNENYYEGIKLGLEKIMEKLNGTTIND